MKKFLAILVCKLIRFVGSLWGAAAACPDRSR